MDSGADEVIGWSIDGMAAGLFGAAIGACLLMLGFAPAAVVAGPGIGMVALACLRRIRPEPRAFRLPALALQEVPAYFAHDERPAIAAVEHDVMALSTMLGEGAQTNFLYEEVAQHGCDEPLELIDRLPEAGANSRVLQLFAPRPLPTPGELARRIDDHLGGSEESRGGRVLDLEVDAAAALRHALGDLRASLA